MDETGFRAVTKDHVGWGGGLTNYIGQNPASEVIVDTPSVRMKPGSTLILCSDGLTNMVEEGDIYNLLTASADPQPLIDAAKAKGGVDNITLITVTWKST
jgi:serine/threonine protein phosphatase PrpC